MQVVAVIIDDLEIHHVYRKPERHGILNLIISSLIIVNRNLIVTALAIVKHVEQVFIYFPKILKIFADV